MKFLDKFKKSLVVLLLPMVSYGLLGPLEIFFGNTKDFNFGYTDFFWILALIALVVWLFGALVLAALPERIHKIANALVLGVGVGSYIQNMFMNIKLSEDDGSPMRWESLGSFTVINLLIWIVILILVVVACVLLKKKWDMVSMAIAGFFSAIQLVAVLSLLLTSIGQENESQIVQMSGKDQLKVASEENIIVFVLDTYGNTRLDETLSVYPDLLDGLQDFTYYDNADCHYYCTFPSMTHMLTGVDFDFDTELSQQWLHDAWNSDRANSFYDTLKEENYSCRLYSGEVGYVYGNLRNLQQKYDNVVPMERIVDKKQVVKLMAKMSIYRYVPYVFKPRFEVLTQEYDTVVSYKEDVGVVDDNAMFYDMLTKNGLSVDQNVNNAFIVQHLFGLHLPYTMDENGMYAEEVSAEQTAKGLTVIVNEYLAQLKELGVYDDATIIITADHGAWVGFDTQPIFMIKHAKETHDEMQVNSAPISLDDFQATILAVLGKETTGFGTSIYDWNPGDIREREVYMRTDDENYPEVKGSSFNVYYGYTYSGDRKNLDETIWDGPDVIVPATPW
ncbi:MAG: hypothetical protein IJZ44_06835 [Lachnospiraceae bacterium]|nr:hypothetical protein [Lachnospiraceae bacterium]